MKDIKFRLLERTVIFGLAALHILNGLYLAGPWYLEESDRAALYYLFQHTTAVHIFGVLLLINGIFLAGIGLGKVTSTKRVAHTFLFGFLLRLYSFIGVMLSLDSWLPPVYLSHAFSIMVLGVFWCAVKGHERVT